MASVRRAVLTRARRAIARLLRGTHIQHLREDGEVARLREAEAVCVHAASTEPAKRRRRAWPRTRKLVAGRARGRRTVRRAAGEVRRARSPPCEPSPVARAADPAARTVPFTVDVRRDAVPSSRCVLAKSPAHYAQRSMPRETVRTSWHRPSADLWRSRRTRNALRSSVLMLSATSLAAKPDAAVAALARARR